MRLVTLSQLMPRTFDRVIDFWEKLLAYAKQKDVISVGGNARVRETAFGTSVTYEPRYPWDYPFRVSADLNKVTVKFGFIDTTIPTIKGISLDGRDAEGEEVPAPVYEFPKDAGPGKDDRSFVCLRMLFDVETGTPITEEEDWLTIEHIADLDEARKERSPGEAFEPLAILYWEGGFAISKITQLVHHNLKHSFRAGTGEGRGEHFFSAV